MKLSKYKNVKDKDNKCKQLNVKSVYVNNNNKNNNNACNNNSENKCWRNLPNKIDLNNWLNKNEEWKNNNTKEKSKNYGHKNWKLIVWKKLSRCKKCKNYEQIDNGNKNWSNDKKKDYWHNICPISKASSRNNSPKRATPSANPNAQATQTSSNYDQPKHWLNGKHIE